MDEKAATAPHAPLLQDDPSSTPRLLVLSVHQAEPFPPISLEALQAFTAYWYSQAQA